MTKKIDDDSDDMNNVENNEMDVENNDVDVEKIDVNIQNSSEMKAEKSNIKTDEDNNKSQIEDTNEGNTTYSPLPWYKNKKYQKIGLFVFLGVVICALVIGLAVGLSKKKPNNPPAEDNNTYIFNYKISTLYFNSVKDETIKTILEDMNSDSKNRRLTEKNNIKTIKSDYLLAIVSKPDNVTKYFTGYVIMLNRKESLNGEDKVSKSFDDSNNIDNDNNFRGLVKIKFLEDGTIIDRLFQSDLNDLYRNEINDTIFGILPKLNLSALNFTELTDNRNLEEFNGELPEYEYGDVDKNKNISWVSNVLDGKLSLDNDALKNSQYNSNINITIQNDEIKQSVIQKTIIIKSDEYEKPDEYYDDTDKDSVLFGKELNDDITIGGLIQSIVTKSNQTLKFIKDGGKELAKKYENKLKNLNLISENEIPSTNRLRVLSNEEYEKNMKLQNEYEKNVNKLRDLAVLGELTDSLAQPITFKYELFKSNVLGIPLALRAHITWTPKSNLINIKLSFQRGTKSYYLDNNEKNITINNYDNVLTSYKTLTMTIIKYLQENILGQIDKNNDKLSKLIQKYLKEYSDKLDSVLEPLSLLFKTYFKTTLDNFKTQIFTNAKDGFNNLYNDLDIITFLESINSSLYNNNESNLKNLISKAETALKDVINSHKSNLTNFVSKVENFITYSTKSINELKDYQKVGIDFYYRVKEIFNRIDVMMDSFSDNLANALDSEFLLLQSYVNDDIYMGQMDALIDNVEVVWDIFKNNDILKETITNSRADIIVNKLELVRKRYEEVKNTFLNKVKNAYENLKNTNIRNGNNQIQSMKTNLNKKENTLIDLIKTKVLYITNYEKYNEDIKKITRIENEISTIKLNAYQTYINNELNKITTDSFLSSTTIKNIEKEIEDIIPLLIDNIKKGKVNEYKNNFNNILSKLTEVSSSSNIENIKKNIENSFSSDNLKKLVSNYYNYVNENGISKYSPLVDEITKNSLDIYISEPVELINKIKGMTTDTEKNTERENDKLQKIVTEKKQNILNDVISRIKNLINTEVNYVRANINSNILKTSYAIIATGEFYTNSNNLIEDLDNKISNYLSKLDSSLGLKTTIQEKEEDINSKISEVAEKLRQNFYYLFCYEKDTLNSDCPNAQINKMDEYDKYYFQLSKLRDALNHLTLLQPYINDVINDDNLKSLSVDEFVNLYKNPINFDVNTVASQVRKYLEVLRKEGFENTKTNVEKLKEIIKKSFTSGNNLNSVIFKTFFNKLFKIQDDLEENLDILFINVTRKARNGYTKDLNKYKDTEFYYDVSRINLEFEFNKTWELYSKKLNETKNNLSYNLKLTDEFNKKLNEKFEDKIYNDINNYRRELILAMTSRKTKDCKLLDNEITLTDIVEEAIIELKNEISSTIKSDSSTQFKEALKEYNVVFETYFKDLHDKIKNQYRYFYDAYHNKLSFKTSIKSTKELKELTEGILEGFEEGINLCIEELKEIINENTLEYSDDVLERIEPLLNDIFKDINFKIPNTIQNIDLNIDLLKTACDKELIREKDSFKDQILEYIKLGFSNTVTNFMKGAGKSYLDGIFLDDYDVNIVPKIDYIHSQVKEIDEYLYLIIEGLHDVDSYLTDSVKEVYYQLMNYINDGITEVEIRAKLLKKIEQFKYDSADKIVDYFKTYTLDILSDNLFKNLFSEQVQLLLPDNVPYTLTLNFSIIYKELLDSSYLSNLKQKYQTNIIEKREKIIDDLKQLEITRSLQIGQLGEGFSSSSLASPITEYNKLNASLSKIDYKFSFELTKETKTLVNNILLNPTIKTYLTKIPKDYNTAYNTVQNRIINNVKLNLDVTDFEKEIKELKDKIGKSNPYEEAEKIREEFFKELSLLYENLEKTVNDEYSAQALDGTSILPINNIRRLDENVDIEIESIQAIINLIDIRFAQLTQNISNSDGVVSVTNKLNQINNEINVQLITLDNTMETYLKYSRFYLKSENTLNQYQLNITNIYNRVENSLKDFFDTQIVQINDIYLSLDNYKKPYYEEVKPDIIKKINNAVNEVSSKLIKKYVNNDIDFGEKLCEEFKKTDLKNLTGLNGILGSTRLDYTFTVHNITLQWDYELKKDDDNLKVYINVNGGGYSNATITYGNEFYNTSIAGSFGKAKIGMNITNNFSNDRVYITYYTDYKNNTYTQTLYEVTTIDSWGVCDDAVDCFVTKDKDYCPYIVRIEDGDKTIVKPESNDLGYYKDSSYYYFTGYYENSLCTFANYFYSAEFTKEEFSSSIYRTI